MTVGGSKEARIVGELWQALGIDPKSTPESLDFRRDRRNLCLRWNYSRVGKEIMI